MQKSNKTFTYTEEQINLVLKELGELPAKQTYHSIKTLMEPIKTEVVNEEKASQEIQQG